ncbi:MAG: hypothetical protein WAT76_11390 [Dokdonella sp.]|uniref:hypothetical protein n=1 Tax=Dokdonella sp. TaxID=2291710 RepID=UPI003BB10B99
MTNSTRGLAVLALTFSVVANAGQADICYSDPYPMIGSHIPTSSTVFHCPTAGNKTLPQLAAENWQVVQLLPISIDGSQGADQILIQKP